MTPPLPPSSAPETSLPSRDDSTGSSSLREPAALRNDLLTKRLGISTVAALASIDRSIARMRADGVHAGGALVDLGSKWGTLGAYIASSLDLEELVSVDRHPHLLEYAAGDGARTIRADLSTDLPLPIDPESAAVITSFGAMEHLPWFDDVLVEAHRLLKPEGWLLMSMPNLGSYVNRVALLAGYQPRDVEIARTSTPGLLPIYRSPGQRNPLGHPHVATLRAMRQLLESIGFAVLAVHGFGPTGPRPQRILDRVFNRFPSLSRRVLILARKSSSAADG